MKLRTTAPNVPVKPTKEHISMHRPIRVTILLLGSVVSMALFASIAEATPPSPAPGWRITMGAQPSNFASASNAECEAEIAVVSPYPNPHQETQCDRFLISVRNEGAAPSDATPITMSTVLPAGMTLVGLGEVQGSFLGGVALPPLACELATASCTVTSTLIPEETIAMEALITVDPSLEGQAVSGTAIVEGGGSPSAAVSSEVRVSPTPVPFALENMALDSLGPDGLTEWIAGGHPRGLTTSLTMPSRKNGRRFAGPVEDPKEIVINLPLGLVGNPESLPQCPEQLVRNEQCPSNTQVGRIGAELTEEGHAAAPEKFRLWNVTPQRGYAAEFGFEVEHRDVFLYGEVVRHADGYAIRVTSPGIIHITETFSLTGVYATFWGDPLSHTEGGSTTPFFSNPVDCGAGPLSTTAWAVSWQQPDRVVRGEYSSFPNGVTGCEGLSFTPTISSQPATTRADNPSGLRFDLEVPQASGLTDPATPPARTVTVALPRGMSINPPSADGLGSCDLEGSEGINLGSQNISVQGQDLGDPEATEYGAVPPLGKSTRFGDGMWHSAPGHCPAASQLGTVEVTTPVLDHPLPGKVFLGAPECSPCSNADAASGKLVKLYMEINDSETGVIIKLAGIVKVDPSSGQLTATFTNLPQLPFSKLHLQLNEGARAPLRTPSVCTNYVTTTDLTPWSAPETPDARPADAFAISSPASDGPCPESEAQQPNSPSFTAGTLTPQAASYSAFVLKVAREDGTQQFGSIEATLPAGLLAKLAGVPYCPDEAIAAAAGKAGRAERGSPSCPSTSEVGSVTVGAGAGPTPYYVQGHAYLAGPYRGAPISLAIITPAVAGPFDLGTVVVRTPLYVDPETARVRAVSDPLPTILAGIPLDIRSVALDFARPQFVLNPTSCEPTSTTGSLMSTTGAIATLSQRFQVGGCKGLKFKPRLQISLNGSTDHAGHPALKAVVTYPKKGPYANIARAQVNLPHSEFLDQSNLNKTCTKPVLLAGNCPANSIYGKAKAWTPLLAQPLEGPVYLVGGYGYKLPALVADLNGQIRVVLKGKVDSGPNKGIRNTFEAVPDAPVSRFVLEMRGGPKYSLLENSENLCSKPQRAIARFTAQNGEVEQTKPLIANDCGPGKGGKKKTGGGRK